MRSSVQTASKIMFIVILVSLNINILLPTSDESYPANLSIITGEIADNFIHFSVWFGERLSESHVCYESLYTRKNVIRYNYWILNFQQQARKIKRVSCTNEDYLVKLNFDNTTGNWSEFGSGEAISTAKNMVVYLGIRVMKRTGSITTGDVTAGNCYIQSGCGDGTISKLSIFHTFYTCFVVKIFTRCSNAEICIRWLTAWQTHKHKWSKSRVQYYANSTACFQIVLSGDVESNPGPISNKSDKSKSLPPNRPQHTECSKTVRSTGKRFLCTICMSLTHFKCANVKITFVNAIEPKLWTCSHCVLSILPFSTVRDLDKEFNDSTNTYTQDHDVTESIDVHLQKLHQYSTHTSIVHLNTQSMCSTFDEFCIMSNIYKYDIITLSETWLKDNHHLLEHVQMSGYQLDYRNRNDKRGGGVGVYVKDHIKFKRRRDIEKIDETIEHMWLEIPGKNKYSTFLLGVLYQPKSDDASKEIWLNKLEHLLSNIIIKWDGVLMLAGDLNIDLLKPSHITKKYTDILAAFKLTQLIKDPTRKGKTLIDHIVTNIPKKVVATGVLPCPEISDHDAAYIIVNIRVPRFIPRFKYIRNVKNFNVESFITDFSQLPFTSVYAVNDPEEKLDIFNTLISGCLDKHAPVTRIRVTRPPAPWMKDLNIASLQAHRNVCRYNAHQTGSEGDWQIFRDVRNQLKKVIKETKKLFYYNALSSKRPKEVWSTIHRILHPNPRPIDADPGKLNKHFATVAERLTGREGKSHDDLTQIINDMPCVVGEEFHLRNVTYNEIQLELSRIRKDCSTGYDNIPMTLIHPVIEYIVSPLTHIINSCIDDNVFPQAWKIARISPVPKSDNPTDSNDYRPVSILPILSKVYERLVLRQIQDFTVKFSLYEETQSGFRKGHSTTTTLLKLKDDIVKAMKKGEITLAIFADYSKAFDTVDFEILINKLHKLNFSKTALHWLVSYLSDRQQYVQVNDKSSSKETIMFGVPQGSILGPVLFNLYVADMQRNVGNEERCLQYADDSTLYQHCKVGDLEFHKSNLEKSLSNISSWSSCINLLFNQSKTKTMLFATQRMARYHNLDRENVVEMVVDNNPIERVLSWKVLGMLFQQNLQWNDHITGLISSCYGVLAVLRKLRRFTPFKVRKQLAEALVLSKLDYCNVLYDSVPAYLIKRMQRVQNSAAGFVFCRYSNVENVLDLKWLPVKERIEFNIAKLTFKAIHFDNWPLYLAVKIKQQTRVLRSNDSGRMLEIPKIDNTFEHSASTIFNSLPQNIRDNDISYGSFVNQVRTVFMERAHTRILNS